ncbi:unnamed protein product [Caenorhabditis sp. 36 PRJEB53466]|nr:unnamed protein product [Caenorhabditis sp. 36 PRJEB53466]
MGETSERGYPLPLFIHHVKEFYRDIDNFTSVIHSSQVFGKVASGKDTFLSRFHKSAESLLKSLHELERRLTIRPPNNKVIFECTPMMIFERVLTRLFCELLGEQSRMKEELEVVTKVLKPLRLMTDVCEVKAIAEIEWRRCLELEAVAVVKTREFLKKGKYHMRERIRDTENHTECLCDSLLKDEKTKQILKRKAELTVQKYKDEFFFYLAPIPYEELRTACEHMIMNNTVPTLELEMLKRPQSTRSGQYTAPSNAPSPLAIPPNRPRIRQSEVRPPVPQYVLSRSSRLPMLPDPSQWRPSIQRGAPRAQRGRRGVRGPTIGKFVPSMGRGRPLPGLTQSMYLPGQAVMAPAIRTITSRSPPPPQVSLPLPPPAPSEQSPEFEPSRAVQRSSEEQNNKQHKTAQNLPSSEELVSKDAVASSESHEALPPSSQHEQRKSENSESSDSRKSSNPEPDRATDSQVLQLARKAAECEISSHTENQSKESLNAYERSPKPSDSEDYSPASPTSTSSNDDSSTDQSMPEVEENEGREIARELDDIEEKDEIDDESSRKQEEGGKSSTLDDSAHGRSSEDTKHSDSDKNNESTTTSPHSIGNLLEPHESLSQSGGRSSASEDSSNDNSASEDSVDDPQKEEERIASRKSSSAESDSSVPPTEVATKAPIGPIITHSVLSLQKNNIHCQNQRAEKHQKPIQRWKEEKNLNHLQQLRKENKT